MQRVWRSDGFATAVAALLLSFVAVAAADALSESFDRVLHPLSAWRAIQPCTVTKKRSRAQVADKTSTSNDHE